jgi:SAM-dependent methyltransferase
MPLAMPSRFCCDKDLARIGYDGQNAAVDLEAWRRDGPRPTTRKLVDVLTAEGVGGAVVLDIGAGVGAVHVGLLEAGAARAVDVDASREYQAAARAEAERRGLAGRVEYRYGDIVELADSLPPADIVTADAVICCYPYLVPFLEAALRSRPRLVGLTYPHEAWWMRIGMRAYNLLSALRHRPEHWFIHRRREIDRYMDAAGYREIHRGGPWYGNVVVYRRAA